jgi:hypothetical protein
MIARVGRLGHRIALATIAVCAIALLAVAPALATPAPRWDLSSSNVPANLAPGGTGKIVVAASNFGDKAAAPGVTITDKLPTGVKLKKGGIHAWHAWKIDDGHALSCDEATVTCKTELETDPATKIKMILEVEVQEPPGTEVTLENEVSASGGGAPPVAVRQPVRISPKAATFGVEKYAFIPEEEDGTADARAGSHPFQLTTTLALNQNRSEEPVELPKELEFQLPPGLIGNPTAIPRCTQAQFNDAPLENGFNGCPADTQVGVAEVTVSEPVAFPGGIPGTKTVPVFNVEPNEGSPSEPSRGEPARLGIYAVEVPVLLDTGVRTGSDYGVNVLAHETSEAAGVLASNVIVWGTPGDPRHNNLRGWVCAGQHESTTLPPRCKQQTEEAEKKEKEEQEKGTLVPPKPFLSLPTSCGSSLRSPMRAKSWKPGATFTAPVESEFNETIGSCEGLSFSPSIEVEPDIHTASTPTGLLVTVRMPENESEDTVAASAIKATTVVLPEGVQLNPAASGGLQACSALQVGFELGGDEPNLVPGQLENNHFSPNPVACPEESKVGTVEIVSPDLLHPLKGAVFLGAADADPFHSPLVGYIVAQDPLSGVLVKLAGSVEPQEGTGRIFSGFGGTPPVPLKELKLHFFGGPRASLSTPEQCGSYSTNAAFTPWSGQPNAEPPVTPFVINAGVGGGPCPPSPQSFGPTFAAGSDNPQAGAFTSFTANIARPDGQQAMTGLSVKLPPGLAGILATLTPCPEPPAGQPWVCGDESLIGHATSSSGLGTEPTTLTGQAYLTTGYDGAPFGLLVSTLAKAGPFNLGYVYVRSRINVDPYTAAVTITTDPGPHGDALPTMLKGVPVQAKQLSVVSDRPNFQFNPTNCTPMHVEATFTGAQGGVSTASSPFQVANCASLPFAPKLTATTASKASKLNGVEFDVTVESGGLGQANIEKVFLTLPKALPSRLTTIQKACPDSTFNANPATCPEGSLIGHAIIHTPVLKNPLTGPAYLVSHGGAAFPDVEFVLQGEGVLVILDGKTDIKNGITYSRFETAPDAPFTKFETILPEGPHSALTAYTPKTPFNLCGSNLEMPTEITAQNGAVIKKTTKVGVKGKCVLGSTTESKLAQALKACRKKFKGKKKHKKLVACERAARKKFGPHKHGSAKKGKKH